MSGTDRDLDICLHPELVARINAEAKKDYVGRQLTAQTSAALEAAVNSYVLEHVNAGKKVLVIRPTDSSIWVEVV